jgi:hypothetical protein
MLDKQKLTGIGITEFFGATEIIASDEFAGVCLLFDVYHGEEDRKRMPNPADTESFNEDFERMIET